MRRLIAHPQPAIGVIVIPWHCYLSCLGANQARGGLVLFARPWWVEMRGKLSANRAGNAWIVFLVW